MYILNGKLLVISALARRMRQLGHKVAVSHISRVLSGEREPGPKFISKFAQALEVTNTEAKQIIQMAVQANKDFREMPRYIKEEE